MNHSHLTNEQRAHDQQLLASKLKRIEEQARRRAVEDREAFSGLQIQPTASTEDDAGGHEPGENNWTGYGFDVHPQVTLASSSVLVIFIMLTLMFQDNAGEFFKSMLAVVTQTSGWFLILASNVFLVAAFYFALSRFGDIKIGGIDAQPEFTTPAWYAMLMSAGMGIGLMFWSVGEPIYHFDAPSPMFGGVEGGTPEAAQAAMGVTFFHWGVHPWAIYAMVGLGLAFFAFNRGLPLTIRSMFYPLLGNRIYGFWGNLIDVMAVLATMVGLATSLGLGVKQINAGMNYIFGVEISVAAQVIMIAVITGIATLSVMAGLDGGVKRLSQGNMVLAGIFLLVLLIAGPTIFLLSGFVQNMGYYLTIFPELSLWTETFRGTNWQGGWTIFYWAWWISWSPFVGMFIARISKGRSVREFIVGVVLIPTTLSFFWMSVFGGSALYLQGTGGADIVAAVQDDVATAMFVMLGNFPFAALLSLIAITLVAVFFVTSSDSGSLVVDHLTSGGKLDSPTTQRVFWAVMEGAIAAVLLIGGGLTTLQTASVSTGLPFALVLLIGVYSLYVGLSQELYIERAVQKAVRAAEEEHLLQAVVANAAESSS